MGNIKEKLRDNFNMKDFGGISSFLGVQQDRRNDVMEMAQFMYLKNILKKIKMEKCKPKVLYLFIKLH